VRELADFFAKPRAREIAFSIASSQQMFLNLPKTLYKIIHFNILFYPQNFPFMPIINLSKKCGKRAKLGRGFRMPQR